MLTLAIPQSEPSWDRNRSAVFIESVKIADDRPCLTPLLMATAFAEIVELDDVQDRGERLDLEDGGARWHLDQRRLDKVPFPIEHLASVQNLSALLLRNTRPQLRTCQRRF